MATVLAPSTGSPTAGSFEPPAGLVQDIQDGKCIAFVGAGFSAPARFPTWHELLERLAALSEDPDIRLYAVERLQHRSSEAYEEVAQILERDLGKARIGHEIRECFGNGENGDAMARRLRLLRGIPFHAILTTNFDGLLNGVVAKPDNLLSVVKQGPSARSLFVRAMEDEGALEWSAPVVKLHGDINEPDSIVLSRLDYRRQLYSHAAYLGFLRSVFLFNTVLYLGFSFTDSYLNQLRSETLEMLGHKPEGPLNAYAVINDVQPIAERHFKETEGIHVLSYPRDDPPNFGGFDTILEAIHNATNPLAVFGRLLSGKRILWVDRRPDSVGPITDRVFPRAAEAADMPPCQFSFATNPDQAIAQLESGPAYDLVVSQWGQHEPGGPTAKRLLSHIRASDIEVPLMVFASGGHAEVNKQELLRRGGIGYYHSWDGLLRGFEHVFSSGLTAG